MIVADTNVLSELMRPAPSASLMQWMTRTSREALATTAITKAEILVGLALLPDGTRRRDLEFAAARMFDRIFAGRVLPFDGAAAQCFAEIVATRRTVGRPIAPFDAQIAAIALAAGASLATRNIADFDGLGLTLHNPWDR